MREHNRMYGLVEFHVTYMNAAWRVQIPKLLHIEILYMFIIAWFPGMIILSISGNWNDKFQYHTRYQKQFNPTFDYLFDTNMQM